MLTGPYAGVEERPQLRPLFLGLPLPEGVPMAEDALLGARLLLVAACPAQQHVEAVLLDRLQECHRLMAVAGFHRIGQPHGATPDRVVEVPDDEPLAQIGNVAVTKVEDLREVVARVDVQEREGKPTLIR